MTATVEDLQEWVGRREEMVDHVSAAIVHRMALTLDRDDPEPRAGDPLPPPWHWMFCVPAVRQSELGPDGHARRGGFLPPIPLPRRMWAGSRIEFRAPLRVGREVRRVSEITRVEEKTGRSGRLIFLHVRHDYHGPDGLAVRDDQDIVYRDAPAAGEGPPPRQEPPSGAAWTRTVRPDPVLLFRYSALTFNGHRIHYDHPYVTGEEGYPSLIVHGPLLGTLLCDLVRRQRPGARMTRFAFRNVRPVYDTAPFTTAGKPEGDGASLWVVDANGALACKAEAAFEEN